MSQPTDGILGFILLARHGDIDINGTILNSTSIVPLATSLTPLGAQQEYDLGQKIRSLYLNSSASTSVSGLNTTVVDQNQIYARADAGRNGDAIVNSVAALLQGMFSNDGAVMGAPNGYQNVEVDNDISLEGWVDCAPFDASTALFYASPEFKAKEDENAAFMSNLSQYLDGRAPTLKDMVYDFMKIESTHNEQFASTLPPTILEKAGELANFHDQGVFTSPQPDGIGNVGGRTLLPSILNGISRIANESDPLKILYEGITHQPFLSLFNMTKAVKMQPALANLMDYAAAIIIEVRRPVVPESDVMLSFRFKNGSKDESFNRFNVLDQDGDVPMSLFISTMAPLAINNTAEWCTNCQNTETRGCGVLATTANQHAEKMSSFGAGFLGAAIGVFVATVGLVVLCVLVRRHKGSVAGGPSINEDNCWSCRTRTSSFESKV
ncbi:phosphoglycerate mutase-like protein [Pluteus cervinus]|uniref:Phosphoglycerate mutase-like protein n=1 Tax=Pluteus cervinus TaxID=181527 RepID=A0ACD3AXE2_9AGAR|nr:phosphoglycerate mutase-like protein [Pluteus cervinus]